MKECSKRRLFQMISVSNIAQSGVPTSHPGSQILDRQSGVLDLRSWIQDPGFRNLDLESQILCPGAQIPVPRSWVKGSMIKDIGSRAQDPGSGISDPSRIPVLRSQIHGPGLGSRIRNPGSRGHGASSSREGYSTNWALHTAGLEHIPTCSRPRFGTLRLRSSLRSTSAWLVLRTLRAVGNSASANYGREHVPRMGCVAMQNTMSWSADADDVSPWRGPLRRSSRETQ